MLLPIILTCFLFFAPSPSSAGAYNSYALVQLEQHKKELRYCMESVTEKIQENSDTEIGDLVCYAYTESGWYECLETFANNMKPYLRGEERYLPDFMLNGLKNSAKKSCDPEKKKMIRETTIKFIDYYFDNPYKLNVFEAELKVCAGDPSLYLNNERQRFYKQAHLCSDIEAIHKCVEQVMAKDTKTDYSEFLDLFFGSFLDECNAKNLLVRGAPGRAASTFQIGMNFPLIVLAYFSYQTLLR